MFEADIENTTVANPCCAHCGLECPADAPRREGRSFCCTGCEIVYELIHENGLDRFYELAEQPGIRVDDPGTSNRWRFLDETSTRNAVIDFADERMTRVTFRIPAIHCVACIWLLENLFRINEGVERSRADFQRKTVSIQFDHHRISLSDLVGLLAALGYEPALNLEAVGPRNIDRSTRTFHLKLGVAGFAFGNIMLMSLPGYLGLDVERNRVLAFLLTSLSLGLTLPVIFFSAGDYWKAAWRGLRYGGMTIDLPISLGLIAKAACALNPRLASAFPA
ncbi:MAG: heavy metal translocating P-type ATPase metal-binding domain-containing protein [Verrucomicrobiota bacterium]